jgi:DNA-binding NarL/FixJ family response regulator
LRVLLAGRNGQAAEVAELLRDPDVEILGRAESTTEAMEMLDALQPDVLVADSTFIEAARRIASSATVVFLPSSPGRNNHVGPEDGSGQLELLRTCVALGSATPLLSEVQGSQDLNGS